MKTLITRILAFSGLALLMLSSCKKEETKAVATSGTAPVLTASATNLVLTKALATNAAINFSWSNAKYGYSAAVTNVLQIDVSGNNFASPKEVTPPANTNLAVYTVLDFNAIALGLGLPSGVNSVLQARVKSTIGGNLAPLYSNVVSVTVNPYTLVSYMYVPGAYQGWNPATADSLKSATSNGIFTGVINYVGSDQHFKITPAKGWTGAYGDAGSGTVSTSGGDILAPMLATVDPAFTIKTNLVTINLNNNTLTMVPTLWGVVGDGTPGGWPNGSGYQSDTDMKYNNGTQMWSVTVALTAGGNIKFRKNHDWGTNLGGSGGTLSSGGANIPVAVAGTYVITLDPVGLTYTLTKQ